MFVYYIRCRFSSTFQPSKCLSAHRLEGLDLDNLHDFMGDGGSKPLLTHVNLSRSLHITPSSAMSDQPRSLILSDAPSSSTPKVSFSGVSRNRATKKDGGKRIGSFSSRPGPDGFHAADDLQSNNVPLRQPPDTLKDKPSENPSEEPSPPPPIRCRFSSTFQSSNCLSAHRVDCQLVRTGIHCPSSAWDPDICRKSWETRSNCSHVGKVLEKELARRSDHHDCNRRCRILQSMEQLSRDYGPQATRGRMDQGLRKLPYENNLSRHAPREICDTWGHRSGPSY